jgi:hypothetical protein
MEPRAATRSLRRNKREATFQMGDGRHQSVWDGHSSVAFDVAFLEVWYGTRSNHGRKKGQA